MRLASTELVEIRDARRRTEATAIRELVTVIGSLVAENANRTPLQPQLTSARKGSLCEPERL
jgi:hypothetical protein